MGIGGKGAGKEKQEQKKMTHGRSFGSVVFGAM
jgi:hypothetical protein